MTDEIITAPFSIWIAPLGTAFPAVSQAPGASWTLLGKRGARSHSTDGVTIEHLRQFSTTQPAGAMAVSHGFAILNGLRVRVRLLDLTFEQYSIAIGGRAISRDRPALQPEGARTLGLSEPSRGPAPFALLIRGPSPYFEGQFCQYEVPRCLEAGNGAEIAFRRAQAAGLPLQFLALRDPYAASEATQFARLVAGFSVQLIEFEGSLLGGVLGLDSPAGSGTFEKEV